MKVHVEADAAGRRYRSAVVYLTSEEPVRGELALELREGVAVTGCWPRWPDEMGERSAVWRIETYPRNFGERVLHSFGIRLDLEGEANLSAEVVRWSVEGGVAALEARRGEGLRAFVGPLAPGYRVLRFEGRLSTIEASGLAYLVLEGQRVALELDAKGQGVLAGHLEYDPLPEELPFELKLRGARAAGVEKVLAVRLEDLHT